MIDTETFWQLALALPNTNEQPHFEKTSFRVGSKIFATLDMARNRACLMLSVIDQSVFVPLTNPLFTLYQTNWGKKVQRLWNLILLRNQC